MKKQLFILLFATSISFCQTYTDSKFEDFVANKNVEITKFWEEKSYEKALSLLKDVCKKFFTLDKPVQKTYRDFMKDQYYNIACLHSLLNQKDSAFVYLNKSLAEGYKNYLNTIKDTDLDNLRNDSRFIPFIEKLKEVGDFKYMLKTYALYKSEDSKLPPFTYLESSNKTLKDLRAKYELDKVAGNGNEISQIINLMKWVHKTVKHEGSSPSPTDKTADALIMEKRSLNCRMLATILNEVYLAMGFKSRFISCMPMGEKFDDNHVINEIFSATLNKWIWMDPTFEVWVTDDKGNYLSIQETRYRLVNDLPVFAPQSINRNGQPYGGGPEEYLHNYMSKNTFRFSIPLNSCSGYENIPMDKRIYVELYPLGYNPKNVEFGKVINNTYYTTDDKQYWAAPKDK